MGIELVARFGDQFIHFLAHLLTGNLNPMATKIAQEFTKNIFVSRLVKISTDDLFRV